MDLWPFIIGCNKEEEEESVPNDSICKEEHLGDAMPLIKIPPIHERITTYQQILDDQLMSLQKIQRTNTIGGQRKEYQFIFDLNSVTDTTLETDMKKLYAFTSCRLVYFDAQALRDDGWDIEDIFGPGRPDAEIGALCLYPLPFNQEFWGKYYPGGTRLDVRAIYFNLRLDLMEIYIMPLIKRYINWEVANEKFAQYEIQALQTPEDEWQKEYYQLFLQHPDVYITISRAEAIGEIDVHVPDSTDKIFRLSMFFLESGSQLDFSPHLETFMRFRGRIPPDRGEDITDLDVGSMAGHPMILQFIDVPVAAARVDFVPQAIFSPKNGNVLALDPDQHPPALIIRRRPSQEQAAILDTIGITQEQRETNQFIIFNPDGQFLQSSVAEAVPIGSIQVTPSQVLATQTQATITISVSDNTLAGRIQIMQTDSNNEVSLALLHDLTLTLLDCKVVPVAFWRLHDTLKGFSAGSVNINTVLASANRILGEQVNVYLYAVNSQTGIPTLPVLGSQNPYDVANTFSLNLISDQLKLISAPECNVIWSWDLKEKASQGESEDLAGVSIPAVLPDTFAYPFMMIEVISESTDEDRGEVLAHEFSHWIVQRFNLDTPLDAQHFDHDKNLLGHDEYVFNVMNSYYAPEHELLTAEQARVINQNAGSIAGAINGSE